MVVYFEVMRDVSVQRRNTLLILYCFEDIDECSSAPCDNGGTCIDAANNYTCNCAYGYTGKDCWIGTCT